jgi:hypothetical protein
MFVRFRQSRRRLQCSLIETHRVDGKVRHEHIAGLGAVPVEPSIADRVAFWTALHQRLGKLSNRFSHDTHGKLIGQIHARIPMPTVDEQRQLQKENAQADEQLWSGLHDMGASAAADHRELAAKVQRTAADSEAAAANAAANVERAKERLAKIEKGEEVEGGLGKPMTYEDAVRVMLKAGFTKRGIRHVEHMTALFDELERRGIENDFWDALAKRREAIETRLDRQAERDVLRKHGLVWRRRDLRNR